MKFGNDLKWLIQIMQKLMIMDHFNELYLV
jgi:hypothetical protein